MVLMVKQVQRTTYMAKVYKSHLALAPTEYKDPLEALIKLK